MQISSHLCQLNGSDFIVDVLILGEDLHLVRPKGDRTPNTFRVVVFGLPLQYTHMHRRLHCTVINT